MQVEQEGKVVVSMSIGWVVFQTCAPVFHCWVVQFLLEVSQSQVVVELGQVLSALVLGQGLRFFEGFDCVFEVFLFVEADAQVEKPFIRAILSFLQ